MNCQAVILDIDGTLWDSRALVAEGYNIQLREEGLEHLCVDAEILKSLFGKVQEEIADVLFGSIPVPERYELMTRCMNREQEHMYRQPCDIGYPKVKQTLEKLAQKHRLFIVSNSEKGYPELTIKKLGLTALIEGHMCFGDTGTSKGQTIRALMKKHRIESAVYVGDTQGDYEATLEAEIPFIWASYGFGKPAGFDKKIERMEDLLSL